MGHPKDSEVKIHAWQGIATRDQTLCGLSVAESIEEKTARKDEVVSCKDCQRIISYCQIHFTVAYRVR